MRHIERKKLRERIPAANCWLPPDQQSHERKRVGGNKKEEVPLFEGTNLCRKRSFLVVKGNE